MDPLWHKYPTLSSYQYCDNNPMRYTDATGDTITISDGDETITYVPGMEYEGTNTNIAAIVSTLNEINAINNGNIVISELSGSSRMFNYSVSEVTEGAGGQVQTDANGNINTTLHRNRVKKGTLAHELFHGYQSLHGMSGASINSEIGAILFSKSIIGYFSFAAGFNYDDGIRWQMSMNSLSQSFNHNSYQTAIDNFLDGSFKNASGIYSRHNYRPIIPRPTSPPITRLYPLKR